MALVAFDRVLDLTTATGTGPYAVAGSAISDSSGYYRPFNTVCSVGDTFYGYMYNDGANEWQSGLFTYSAADQITLTTLSQSSTGSAVSFTAGAKYIALGPIASFVPSLAKSLAQFPATTSAELRGVLSDETGTGLAYFQGGDIGTPSAGVLTNATGLPVGTGISGLGTNVATFLATPSSANLAAAVTDETGFNTGAKAVFSAGPTLDAGTTAIPAIKFTSGTNLTTADAGAWEYNGSVPFFTPSGTQRGLVPAMQFFRLNANLAGINGTGTQNVFGKSATVSSSTVYRFNAFITLNKTAGSYSHTLTFSIGGSAVFNTSNWGGIITSNASALPTALALVGRSTSNSLTATAAITTAAWNITLQVFGTISVATGGTFNLNYALSAAPGGAYSTIIGSCIELWPVGATGADINVGTWA
jgi:hypothetical protein